MCIRDSSENGGTKQTEEIPFPDHRCAIARVLEELEKTCLLYTSLYYVLDLNLRRAGALVHANERRLRGRLESDRQCRFRRV